MILGLDTTGPYCSVSLVDTATVRGHINEKINRGHAERLAPMVAEVFSQAGIAPNDVKRLAVCTGPGSFTGLRVALAFAKGFALPRRLPVIGISALEVMAAQIDPHKEKRIISIMDVRRGQVCWAGFDKSSCTQAPLTQDISIAKTEIAAHGYDRLAGNGAPLIAESSPVMSVSTPALAWLAENRTPETHPAIPLYSRGPDAKLPGGKTL